MSNPLYPTIKHPESGPANLGGLPPDTTSTRGEIIFNGPIGGTSSDSRNSVQRSLSQSGTSTALFEDALGITPPTTVKLDPPSGPSKEALLSLASKSK